MKKAKRILALSLALIMMMSLIACSKTPAPSTDKGEQKEIKLTIWINGKDSYIGPDEQKKPQEEWYISKAFKRFEAANPGVKIELVVPPDSGEAHQTFKAAGVAGTAPDIANLWTGQNIFALKDVILPINSYIPADDQKNISGWDAVTLDFKKGGDILGYPTSDNQLCFFLFNRKILKDCGLDFDKNPPRTMADFDAACKTIAAKGYQPIASDESFPWYYCYVGVYWWLQTSGRDRILSDCAGTTKFAEDKGLLDSLAYYKSNLDNKYLNADAVTSADSWNRFAQGKVAMMPQVSSVISDAENALGAENVGVMLPPDFSADAKITGKTIGGPGQCLVVSKNSKNPEMAVKFLSFLSSKAEVLEFLKYQKKIPVRTDITTEELGYKEGSAAKTLSGWTENIEYWVDNSLTPAVAEDFYKLAPQVLGGQMKPLDFAKALDAKAGK